MTIDQHVNECSESCLRDGVCLSDGEIDIVKAHVAALCLIMIKEGRRQHELFQLKSEDK